MGSHLELQMEFPTSIPSWWFWKQGLVCCQDVWMSMGVLKTPWGWKSDRKVATCKFLTLGSLWWRSSYLLPDFYYFDWPWNTSPLSGLSESAHMVLASLVIKKGLSFFNFFKNFSPGVSVVIPTHFCTCSKDSKVQGFFTRSARKKKPISQHFSAPWELPWSWSPAQSSRAVRATRAARAASAPARTSAMKRSIRWRCEFWTPWQVGLQEKVMK